MITLEMVRDEWLACYPAERLERLYDRPHSPLEVLTRSDGEWATVPGRDRLWTVLRPQVLSDRTLRMFACDCAERALLREREAGREPPKTLWKAVAVARRFAVGDATESERFAAAAYAADAYAARAADADAADAAADAEREWQVKRLTEMLEGGAA